MKRDRKRMLSLLLALAMLLSLTAPVSWAAELAEDQSAVSSSEAEPAEQEQQEEPEEPGQMDEEEPEVPDQTDEEMPDHSVVEPDTDPEEPAAEPEGNPEEPDAQAEASEGNDVQPLSEGEVDPADESQGDESAEELKTQGSIKITETLDLKLEYDDRYTFTKLKKGYVVAQISAQKPTSYVVAKGAVTETRDKAVLTLTKNSDVNVTASGVGTATVLLVPDDELDAAKKLLKEDASVTETVEAAQVSVTVVPAKLTIMFLAGQSNMEGYGSYTGSGTKKVTYYQHPEQSIVCEEGQVYSTYAPGQHAYKAGRANGIGGNVNFSSYCTVAKAPEFVAGALTGNKSIKGKALTYPINQLTAAGKGKNGPDSGLAYEWNRLTGDKVWTVNAAWGDSGSVRWVPGKDCYDRAAAVYKNALKTYNAEIKAGHYSQGRKLFFWLQGEKDKNSTSVGTYFSNFKKMHDGMKKVCGFSQMGIISVRAALSIDHYRDAQDIKMTSARIIQTYLANTDSFSDIHMVSDVNEQWVTDKGVKAYFKKAYGSALSYKTHGKTPALPTKVSQVHNDIHFLQVGHNENGLTAARGMYQVVTGAKAKTYSVKWRNKNGTSITKLSLNVGKSAFVSPAVDPVSSSKPVNWRFSSGLSYAGKSATLTAVGYGKKTIEALTPDGKVFGTLQVTVKPLATPVLTGAVNAAKGVTVSWKKVSGAEAYLLFRKAEGESKWSKAGKTTGVSLTDSKARNGVRYTYTVRCVTKDGKTYTSDFDHTGKTVRRLSAPTLKSAKNTKGKKLAAQWTKCAEAEGYQIQYSTSKQFSGAVVKNVKGVDTLSATLTGLKKKKTYYVRVRSWHTAGGGYDFSPWSGVKKVKISK